MLHRTLCSTLVAAVAVSLVSQSEAARRPAILPIPAQGVAPTNGKALNAGGTVVGGARFDSNVQRGFVWQDRNRNRQAEAGEMVNLMTLLPPDSGWTLLEPADINDRGQITGVGRFNGQDLAFVMNLR